MVARVARGTARAMARRLMLAFFVAAALLAHAQLSTWNVSSRMAAIESIVDRGTFAIDASPFRTGDKYRYRGRFYSDKPPVLSIAGAGIALVLRAAHLDIVRHAKYVQFALTVLLVALPFAIGVGTLYELEVRLGIDRRWAAGVATIAGSATLAFPFATVLLNHVPAATLLLIALYAIVRFRRDGGLARVAGAGACLALALGIDTSYAIFVVLLPIALGRVSWRAFVAYALGAAPLLIALAATDLALSGNIRPPDTNAPLFDWPGSEFGGGNLAGTLVRRNFVQTALYAANMLVGVRGLFLYSPILLFGTWALVRKLRDTGDFDRSIYRFIAIATSLYIASAIIATIDYGGDAFGMRTFVGITLLLCVPLGTLGVDLRANARLRAIFLATLAVSTAIALSGVNDPFSSRPFPLAAAIPDLLHFTLAHRMHGLLDVAALSVFGTLAFTFVVRTLGIRTIAGETARSLAT